MFHFHSVAVTDPVEECWCAAPATELIPDDICLSSVVIPPLCLVLPVGIREQLAGVARLARASGSIHEDDSYVISPGWGGTREQLFDCFYTSLVFKKKCRVVIGQFKTSLATLKGRITIFDITSLPLMPRSTKFVGAPYVCIFFRTILFTLIKGSSCLG